MRSLIKNATIITQNENRETIKGSILIDDGMIREVSEKIESTVDEVLEAEDMIAIPGLVNSHVHATMSILRGYGEDLPLGRWLREKIWPVEAMETAEHARASAMLAFCEMIRSGTTCFSEMCIIGAKEIKEAAEKIGMRGIIAQGLMDQVPGKSTDVELDFMKKSFFESSDLIRPSVGPHSPYTCSEELLIKAKEFSKEKRIKCQIHSSETREEVFGIMKDKNQRPLEYLDSLGLMDNDTVLSHASWVSKREIELVGGKNVSVCSCPISNLKLATGGICPLREYDSSGANVLLGTDSAASNNRLDMFETMKIGSLLQKHKYWKADALDSGRFLDFSTRNGAKALGWNCGSIEAGKLADIVLIKKGTNMIPENDLISNIVYSCGPENISDVFIEGRHVLAKGKIMTVDEDSIIREASECAQELIK